MWIIINWYNYGTFTETFDDLNKELGDESKYLLVYLKKSIPEEAWWGFFDILQSIFNNIHCKKNNEYPESEELFKITTDYIVELYSRWIIKVKLITPNIHLPLLEDMREWHARYEYVWENQQIYQDADKPEELRADMYERYRLLKIKQWEINEWVDLINIYTMTGIYISYWNRPFYDELQESKK